MLCWGIHNFWFWRLWLYHYNWKIFPSSRINTYTSLPITQVCCCSLRISFFGVRSCASVLEAFRAKSSTTSDVLSLSFSGFGRTQAFHFLNFSGFGRTRVPTFRARAGFEFIKRASGGYWAFTTSKHNYFFHNLRKAKTQFIKIYKVWVMKSFLEKFFCINLLNKQNYSMLQILEL